MLGSIIFGQLSDKYASHKKPANIMTILFFRFGRKLIFFISLVIQVVFGLIAAFAPELWSFSLARAIVGATTSGVFLVAYVIGKKTISHVHVTKKELQLWRWWDPKSGFWRERGAKCSSPLATC